MHFSTAALAALAGAAGVYAKTGRTFAVLHHYGKGPLMTGRVDPVVNPGAISGHVHTVMGASNFGMVATGESLKESNCTTALPKADKSAYWFPALYFQDPKDGHFEPVEMFYSNVYYFFEATNDQIKAFPTGLKMISGDATRRTAPNLDGTQNLDPSAGPVNPLQWTCPRSDFNPPSWPAGSDGTKAGIQDPNNKGSGIGFPFQKCNGYASPLRMDLHFPSCHNPAAGLENYKTNMAFPTKAANGNGHDCPAGWIHTPHIFFEVYWNTPKFDDRWTVDGKSQPFVLANGDRTGYSGHGDFIAGWDEPALQQMIDNCDAGDAGMDKCPGLMGGLNDRSTSCNINSPVNEIITGNLAALPGNNPVSGWGVGTPPAAPPPVANPPAASNPPVVVAPNTPTTPASKPTEPANHIDSSAPAVEAPTANAPAPGKPETTATPPADDPTPPAADTTAAPQATDPPAAGGAANPDSTSTIWETVTAWKTTTVMGTEPAAPTAAPAAPSVSSTPIPVNGTVTPVNGTDSTLPDVAGFAYAGCFRDARDRALAGEIRPNLGRISNTLCITYCKSKGWALAGTEYGGQCYCGNSLAGTTLLTDAECTMPCEGAADEICGGDWALSVYSVDGSATVANKKARRHLHNHLARHRSGPSARRR